MQGIAAIAILIAGCGGAQSATTTADSEHHEGPETVALADLPVGATVSESYRFSLRPSGGWHVLPEQHAVALGPAVAAAAERTDGPGWGIVVVESAPGLSLERAADLVVRSIQAEEREVISQEPTGFAGYPALRQVVVGLVQGMPVRWVNLMFMHQGHLYRLCVWGDGLNDPARLETFYETFALLEGEVVQRPRDALVEAQGVDWRVDDGVFRSIAGDLAVAPDHGWRLMVGSHLRAVNNDAEVGLAFDEPAIYAIVIAERVPESQYGPVMAYTTRQTTHDLGGQSEGVQALPFLGRELTMSVFHHDGFEHLFGVRCEDGLCRQLLVWYPEQAAEEARARLATMPEIRVLQPAERDACAAAIARSQVARRTTGPNHAYRGNTYVDFQRGMRLEVPAGSYWNLHGEDEARQVAEAAELHLTNPVLGLHGIFMTEAVDPSTDRAGYHALVREAVGIGPGGSSAARLGQAAADFSRGSRDLGFGSFGFVVITTVADGRGYRFVFWGWPEHMDAARRELEALLAGVSLAGGPIPDFTFADHRFVDHHFGHALTLPGDSWEHADQTPASSAGISSVHMFRDDAEDTIVEVLAVSAPGDGGSVQLARQSMEAGFRRVLAAAGEPTRGTGTLGGRSAEVSRWTLEGRPIELRITSDGNITYGLLVMGREAESIARTFEILP